MMRWSYSTPSKVAGLFVAEERGSRQLKGVPEPVTLFRIARASGGGRRAGQRNLTPLVGRDEEIAMLMRRWERARQANGQMMLIVGEPGLGKSRLIEEFHARLREVPHTWVEWSCSSYTRTHRCTRSPNGAASVSAARTCPPSSASLNWKVRWRRSSSTRRRMPHCPPHCSTSRCRPNERRIAPRKKCDAGSWRRWSLGSWPARGVSRWCWRSKICTGPIRPRSMFFAVWPSVAHSRRSYIIATTRPEFRPPWSMRSHHGTISLASLDRSQVREMVAELSARHALPREVVEEVTARTGGVPLFVEEVTRLLLERGEQGGIQAIPPTLQQSLMATARPPRPGPRGSASRLRDRTRLSYGLLRVLAGMDDAALQSALERLAEADILGPGLAAAESDYRFKHALIQDAAYENLLKSRRTVLHRRVAEILRDTFPAIAVAEPEVLAHHFTQAGLIEAAIEWWAKAGQRSLQRSAMVEATEQLTRALGHIATLPATRTLRREEIELQVALITPLLHVKGFAAPETKAAAERARLLIEQAEALGEPPDDPLLLFSVLYSFWVASLVAFNANVVRNLAAQFLALAEKQKATVPLTVWASPHGHVFCCLRETSRKAERISHRRVRALRSAEHRPLATRFGHETRVSTLPIGRGPCGCSGPSRAARTDAQQVLVRVCARDRPSRHADVYCRRRTVDRYLLRRLRGSKRAS